MALTLPLQAQDPFEIHVYEYEPMELGQTSLEAHLNFDPRGSTAPEGTLLRTRNQTHLTLEPTVGLLPELPICFMFLSAWEPGNSPQYAGWRVLPHFYAPESWDLPVKIGFVAEFSFQNTRYEENSREWNCGRSSIASFRVGNWCLIRCLSGRSTARAQGTGGTLSRRCWCGGSVLRFPSRSNTTAKSRASMSRHTRSRRCT